VAGEAVAPVLSGLDSDWVRPFTDRTDEAIDDGRFRSASVARRCCPPTE
jgi:hypothetical protein